MKNEKRGTRDEGRETRRRNTRLASRVSRLLFAAAMILIGAPGLARAQDAGVPLVTDRPDQTESALTVPKSSVQVETGWSVAGTGGANSHAFLGTLLRYGVGANGEMRFGFGGMNRTAVGNWEAGEIEIGFKQRLHQGEGTNPNIALLVHVVIQPDGGRFLPNGRISLSHELSPRVSTGYNVGVAAIDAGPNTQAEIFYTWTVGVALAERVGAFVEAFGATPLSNPRSNVASIDGGFTFSVSPLVQLDISGGVGVRGPTDDWFLGAGLAVRLPR